MASLDPLARREFLQHLMEAVAEHELSVVLSSHLVADLERVCDYLVVLVDSRVQVSGDVDVLLADARTADRCRVGTPTTLPASQQVIEASHTDRQSTLIVRTDEPVHDPRWTVEPVGLEDLVLAYMTLSRDESRGPSPRRGGGSCDDLAQLAAVPRLRRYVALAFLAVVARGVRRHRARPRRTTTPTVVATCQARGDCDVVTGVLLDKHASCAA